MNDENTRLVLKIIHEHPVVLYITGVFVSLLSGAYVLNFIKGLLPKKEEKDDSGKSEGSPAAIIINPSDDIVERYEKLVKEQQTFMKEQRNFYMTLIRDTIVEKQLDDTVPIRDEVFKKIDEMIDTSPD